MKKNIPLIIGIALPIIFIVVISAVIFLPSLFVAPAHNFLYSTDETVYYNSETRYKNTYQVIDGRIILVPASLTPNAIIKGDMPPLYLYDVKAGASHEITFADTQRYALDPGPSSPDGYTLSYQYVNDGMFDLLGSNGNQNGYYVSKGNARKRLDGLTTVTNGYYQGDFSLVGWVR